MTEPRTALRHAINNLVALDEDRFDAIALAARNEVVDAYLAIEAEASAPDALRAASEALPRYDLDTPDPARHRRRDAMSEPLVFACPDCGTIAHFEHPKPRAEASAPDALRPCTGCGSTDPAAHVYGEKACCPDCEHPAPDALRAALERAVESCYATKMPPAVMRSPEAVVVHMREVLQGVLALASPPDAAEAEGRIDYTNHHNAAKCPYCSASAGSIDVERLREAWSTVFAEIDADDWRIARLARAYDEASGH